MNGIVLNIQRFSTHDGPGIRTTVFLKGCTCACAWCHNPESIHLKPEIQIFADRCIACNNCLECCPVEAHQVVDGRKVYHRDRCQLCGTCIENCFAEGIVWAGKSMSADEVMAEVIADEAYYRRSGGGITFSGGEPVLQKDFLLELLKRCRQSGLHTAIQTAGNYRWDWLEQILPHVDLVMYDLKVWDAQKHWQYVGAPENRIRGNLSRLASTGTPLVVRTPLVGGVNDTEEEIANIARFIGGFDSLLHYELMPYHRLGNAKRQTLDLADEDPFYTPDRAQLQRLKTVARTYVAEVKPQA